MFSATVIGAILFVSVVDAAFAATFTREQCIAGASAHYLVHPDIIRAILRQEGGRVGAVSWNRNGTYDIGPMQINSSHLSELRGFGISRDQLLTDECLNIYIGTWMLKKAIVTAPNVWAGIGDYHSHTPDLNVTYQWQVWQRLAQVRGGR